MSTPSDTVRSWRRRDVLRVGAAAFGLSLPALLRQERAQAARSVRARAKSVIILYLSGGPSQLDTFDLKPDAPEEIRGTFRPVRTTVPGVHVCEHLPRTAKLAHRYAVVRSMSHPDTNHVSATYWTMTGTKLNRPVIQRSTMARNDHPHPGAVLARELGTRGGVPAFVTVPEFVSPVGPARPGQHAGFLGARFDPYLVDSDPSTPEYSPGALVRHETLSSRRISDRRDLSSRLKKEASPSASDEVDAYRARAFDLVNSTAAQQAFDLSREPDRTRERYGRHTFGQSCLLARRLIEAGVRLVQVNWVRHDNGKGGQGYDSHSAPPYPPHLTWLKDTLLPPTDAGFAALVEDLHLRGLLDETLVVMMGEFGRTPRFNGNGGRDHWSRAYSAVLAGGGVAGGRVYGATDQIAAQVERDPVAPGDLMTTAYHLLGIEGHQQLTDLSERPLPLVEGSVVKGLLS